MILFNNRDYIYKNLKAFTLTEVLVGTFLVLIVFLSVFAGYQFGAKVIGQSKNKIVATAIANEEIEKIRNLSYGSIGIIDGTLPTAEGTLESESNAFFNNAEYIIKRKVEYISDEANENLSCPLNYKRVEIKVSWGGTFPGDVKMVTDIAPKNKIEEISSCEAQPGGILSVKVFDAYGIMVNSPLVEIFNPDTKELIAFYTPLNGKIDVPLTALSYEVAVSKTGYSLEKTYGEDEVDVPIKSHPIILEGRAEDTSFSIDKLGGFSINTLFPAQGDDGPVPIPNANFNLQGNKVIGYNADESPVYKYFENHISDSEGELNIFNLEWDNYFFSVDPETGLNLVEIEPEPDPETQAIGLSPDSFLQVNLYLESENSLLIEVKDDETSGPVFSAEVRVYNSGFGYDNTLFTNEMGQVFFIPLLAGNYNLEIKAPGYLDCQGQVSVSGHKKSIIEIERIE